MFTSLQEVQPPYRLSYIPIYLLNKIDSQTLASGSKTLKIWQSSVRVATVVRKLEKKGDLYACNRPKFYDRFDTLAYEQSC